MKTLIIYTFNQIDNITEEDYDIISDQSCVDLNALYMECPKTYCYYLFADFDVNFSNDKLNEITNNLKTFKPAILEISHRTKIYHRSVIHYVYPLMNFKRYGNYIYDIQEIIEEPLQNYKQELFVRINNKRSKNIVGKMIWNGLYKWFKPCIKKKYNSNSDEYIVSEEEMYKINFLNTFNVYNYFDVDHKYFKMKSLKFHKNNKEMYGYCTMHHFRHDFHNINRNSIINHLIKKYNYKRYLEIGVYNCYHFNEVYIEEKFGVDPSPKKDDSVYEFWKNKIYQLTSLEFWFGLDKDEKFDIIFIDGCLYEYNVMKDVEQSLKHLTPNGSIILHDCNPPSEYLQRDNYDMRYEGMKKNKVVWNNRGYTDRHWNGKAWKVITTLRTTRKDLEVCVVDCDWGVGIIRKGQQELFNMVKGEDLDKYETLIKYRKYMLELISPEKFLEIYD